MKYNYDVIFVNKMCKFDIDLVCSLSWGNVLQCYENVEIVNVSFG